MKERLNSFPWVRQMLMLARNFLGHYVAPWVCNRKDWKTVTEWLGPSKRIWLMLCVTNITLRLWFYFGKDLLLSTELHFVQYPKVSSLTVLLEHLLPHRTGFDSPSHQTKHCKIGTGL